MAASFNQQFDQHGAWRREFSLRLKLLGDWMKDHELLDAALQALGGVIRCGHRAEHLELTGDQADVVVISSAVRPDNQIGRAHV